MTCRAASLWAALALNLAACGEAAPPLRDPRSLLIPAIRSELAADPRLRAARRDVPRALRVTPTASTVVPGLVYHRGVFPRPDGREALAAVVGARGDVSRLLRTDDDWYALVKRSGWVPGDAGSAVAACSELATHVGAGGGADAPRIFDAPSDSSVGARGLHAPRAERVGTGGWTVTLWTMEQGASDRRTCRFLPTPGGGLQVALERSDSMALPPALPGR